MVRIWTIHPRFLDRKGLGGQWREAIQMGNIVQENRLRGGYCMHPQHDRIRPSGVLEPHMNPHFNYYLHSIYGEATHVRGYNYNTSFIGLHNPLGCPECLRQAPDILQHKITPLNPAHIPKYVHIDAPKYSSATQYRYQVNHMDTILRDNEYTFEPYQKYSSDVYPLLRRIPRGMIQYGEGDITVAHSESIVYRSPILPLPGQPRLSQQLQQQQQQPQQQINNAANIIHTAEQQNTNVNNVTIPNNNFHPADLNAESQVVSAHLIPSGGDMAVLQNVTIHKELRPILGTPQTHTWNEVQEEFQRLCRYHFGEPRVGNNTSNTSATTTTTTSSDIISPPRRRRTTSRRQTDTANESNANPTNNSTNIDPIQQSIDTTIASWNALPRSYKAIPVTLGQVLYEWCHLINRLNNDGRNPEQSKFLKDIYIDINYHTGPDHNDKVYRRWEDSNNVLSPERNIDPTMNYIEKHPYETQFEDYGLPAWINVSHPDHLAATAAFTNVPDYLKPRQQQQVDEKKKKKKTDDDVVAKLKKTRGGRRAEMILDDDEEDEEEGKAYCEGNDAQQQQQQRIELDTTIPGLLGFDDNDDDDQEDKQQLIPIQTKSRKTPQQTPSAVQTKSRAQKNIMMDQNDDDDSEEEEYDEDSSDDDDSEEEGDGDDSDYSPITTTTTTKASKTRTIRNDTQNEPTAKSKRPKPKTKKPTFRAPKSEPKPKLPPQSPLREELVAKSRRSHKYKNQSSSIAQIKLVKELPPGTRQVLHINDLIHPMFYIVDGEIEYFEVIGEGNDLGQLKLFKGL